MDVFSRTFLPATSDARLPIPLVSRHMLVMRQCVDHEETALLVARALRPGTPLAGGFLLLLTNRSLVITRESRLLHRVQLHLAAPLRELAAVRWHRDERGRTVTLAATASDGVRERFAVPVRDPRRTRHTETVLTWAFGPRSDGAPASPHTAGPPRTAVRPAPRSPAVPARSAPAADPNPAGLRLTRTV